MQKKIKKAKINKFKLCYLYYYLFQVYIVVEWTNREFHIIGNESVNHRENSFLQKKKKNKMKKKKKKYAKSLNIF